MRISVLQHSTGTPPGLLSVWALERGHELDIRPLHLGAKLPDVSKTPFVVILGGPMNVDDLAEHGWLKTEKDFIAAAIKSDVAILGLCLGGQLLAQALGGQVKKNQDWEVGWHDITLTAGSAIAPYAKTNETKPFFQWHQDCFSLPPGAELIATNSITENQAFSFGKKLVGFQFHPEATLEWVVECLEEKAMPTGPHVQPVTEIMKRLASLAQTRVWFFEFLDRMAKHATDSAQG